ncbi:MAG: helix-turn-helix transcriptional regulator [Dysgonamonadaceae bacterium]|jgi:AraC-like DNA-binding protein|nr:helix-turn-helix transcriptional regulator [Dysgonamonadaceae bacterium]
MNNCKKSADRKFFFLCNNCDTVGKPNIKLLSLATKRVAKKKSEEVALFFLMDGQIEVSCGEVTRPVEKGYFFLIPANESYMLRAIEKARLAVCYLGEKLLVRHKRKEGLLYDIYNMKVQVEDCELFSVKINRYVQLLLDDCEGVMSSGFVCARYAQCKTEELLILLRSYYPDELLARMFYPAFNGKIDFHQVIKANRDKFFTVEEYAAATNLDRNTFRQKFKETYGRNPNEWIKQERVKQVFQALVEGNKSIADIVNHYKFSNFPNFIRFCNLHYKNTPGNIRKIMDNPS